LSPNLFANDRVRLWIVIVLVIAALVGMVVGGTLALRSRGFGAPTTPDASVRPTFVVAERASPSASPGGSASPAAVPPGSADEYVVEPGDTLRSIAERVYGDAAQWSRIYDANRAAIGADPDTITAGTHLRIPR
jgi:nucleoid-associated protein YgaU